MDSVQVAENNFLSSPANGTPIVPLVENSSTNHLASPPNTSSSSVDVGAGEHQSSEEGLRNPNTGNNTSNLVHQSSRQPQQQGHVLQQGNEVAGQFKTPQQPQSQQQTQQNAQPSTPDTSSSISMLSPQYQQQLQQVQQQHQQQQNIASVFPQQKLQQQGVPQQMMSSNGVPSNSASTQPFMPSPSSSVSPVNAMNNLANMAAASPPNNAFAGLTNAVPNNNGAGAGADTGSPNSNNQQLVRSGNYTDKGAKYIDLTDYLALPQTEAARRLGIPTSTLSKRWKEAVVNRKWPYRMVCKLNKEIMTLLHNVPQGPGAPPLPPEVEQSLGILLRRRQEELRGVVIRI